MGLGAVMLILVGNLLPTGDAFIWALNLCWGCLRTARVASSSSLVYRRELVLILLADSRPGCMLLAIEIAQPDSKFFVASSSSDELDEDKQPVGGVMLVQC